MLHVQPGDESYGQFAQERDGILTSLARRAKVEKSTISINSVSCSLCSS